MTIYVVVTRGDGTQRIEVLYECHDKIEWLDFDELKYIAYDKRGFFNAHSSERVLYKGGEYWGIAGILKISISS